MMDIIKIENAGYPHYEELLLRRDRLRKEAHFLQMEYMREFGEAITSLFEKKIRCIQKKKTIRFCQAARNQGRDIDQNALQEYIKNEMAEYEKQLSRMIQENDAAHAMIEIPDGEVMRIKRIYRRLAKILHPDINPKIEEIPELKQLWNMVVVSYNSNSLKDLQEAEVLVNRALKENHLEGMILEIPDLEEKIARIEDEIDKIKGTDPYQYKYLLSDQNLVKEKKESLQAEWKEYDEYEKDLDHILDQIIGSGVNITWRMN